MRKKLLKKSVVKQKLEKTSLDGYSKILRKLAKSFRFHSMTHSSTNARPPCPYCGYSQLLKNGITHHKKQKYLCKVCRRQFIENPTKKYIDSTTKLTIKRLLLEKIPLIGIARSLQISMTWLQKFVNNFYRCIPCQVKPKPKDSLDLVIECDELWSFVRSKENAVYVWLAINRKTQEIVGVYFGDRSRKSAREFWNSLSQEYRQQAKVYTDLWLSYQEVIPPAQHQPSSKKVAKLLEYKDSIIP